MITPLDPANVPPDYNDQRANLEFMIEQINQRIAEEITANRTGFYENDDGTRDRFRCVIYFDGNINDKVSLRAGVLWYHYHSELMNAYESAGWTIHRGWFGGTFKNNRGLDVVAYCIALPLKDIATTLDEMQDRIQRP